MNLSTEARPEADSWGVPPPLAAADPRNNSLDVSVEPVSVDLVSRFLADASADTCVRTYQRIAPVYDAIDGAQEWLWKQQIRADLLRHARGRVLDVGVGTGRNLPHYPREVDVVGVDLSSRMLDRAKRRAVSLDRPVSLTQMDLLHLDFPDRTFDTLVATFVLLCLPDSLQLAALRELRRVCKPDGSIFILDYRLSRQRTTRLAMHLLSPWVRLIFNRRYEVCTENYVASAGLRPARRQAHLNDAVVSLVLQPA